MEQLGFGDKFSPEESGDMIYIWSDELEDYLDMGYDIDRLHVMDKNTLYPDSVVNDYKKKTSSVNQDSKMVAEVRQRVRKVLYEAFQFDNNKTFTPPPNVAQRAQEALNAAHNNNLTTSGTNTGSGLSKAKELASKQTQSFDQMRRLKSFFETNQDEYNQDKQAGKTVKNSGIIQAWELHGGDSGKDWVNQEMGSLKQDNLNTKKNLRKAGGAATNKGMGIFDTNMMSTNNHRFHR